MIHRSSLMSEEDQLKVLKSNRRYAQITEVASIENGIKVLNTEEAENSVKKFENFKGTATKFVPASGAASRMFKHLKSSDTSQKSLRKELIQNMSQLPFFRELKTLIAQKEAQLSRKIDFEKDFSIISELILEPEGLGYGRIPKGLIPFHSYAFNETRTPFQEQIMEAKSLVVNSDGIGVHFTVSELFRDEVEKHLSEFCKANRIENIRISFSVQSPLTDTISIHKSGEVVKNNTGDLVKRPGGHGALIFNLNEINSDLIFIKNIDNVVIESDLEEQVYWKKVLAGRLLEIEEKIFTWQEKVNTDSYSVDELKNFFEKEFHYTFENISDKELKELLFRPIRVCGMVKNDGQPGGGPFFVKTECYTALQIVESAEIDKLNDEHLRILRKASHFNPVDIVCSVKNNLGEKYNLTDYVDTRACFTSYKDYNGEEIKVLELPGLWNGAMAKWNTVFVEVPASSFNPVKTVNDLFKRG